MSYARPQHEDVFVKNYLKKEIQALVIDSELQQKFIDFAAKEAHANPNKFRARVYHIVNGRTPSAYIALLLVDFFQKRKYEEVVRKVVDHVEYITPDGKTDDLEEFVSHHPLQLRILKVKNQKHEDQHSVIVVLRTPITPPDWNELDEEDVGRQANKKSLEFQRWLSAQGPLPDKVSFSTGVVAKLEYAPEAIEPRYAGEWTFEERSNLSGMVDIGEGVDLLLFCSLKDKAPSINSQGLDLFFSLWEVLGRDWAGKSAEKYSTKQLWQKLTEHASCLPHAFFQEQQCFSPTAVSVLKTFFDGFAKRHAKLAKRTPKDSAEMDRLGESYTAKSEVFRLYKDARRDYAEALLPLLNANKKQIVNALQRVMEIYNKRAQEHFSKLRGTFEAVPTKK